MTHSPASDPIDHKERKRALTEKDLTFLVEAGAGSGKTSMLAGRIALLIASGEDPGAIAAITFTEVAAAELRSRIESFVREIAAGIVPRDLATIFPSGVPADVSARAVQGLSQFDNIVATTIHGFAQILLRPYPLEAGMDPGATIADPEIANLAFEESVEGWMRDALNSEVESFLTALFEVAPTSAADVVRTVAAAMRRARGLLAPDVTWDTAFLTTLRHSVNDWITRFSGGVPIPESLRTRTSGFAKLLSQLDTAPADPVAWILSLGLPSELTTQKGEFNAKAGTKKDWETIGKPLGWGKVDIETRVSAMTSAWDSIKNAWDALKVHAASVASRRLTEEVTGALRRYADWKRAAALLDFDDLLVKAQNLLSTNEGIRKALGTKYRRLLVDEFQDTDPLQTEIVWRICGDPSNGSTDWQSYRIRPGALFLVGDPKQAIYRFRGADVAAYLSAKATLVESGMGDVLPISVNFRSTEQILTHVNRVYQPVLDGDSQPGFTGLSAFRTGSGPEVQALDIQIPDDILDDRGNPSSEGVRQAEAEQLAEFLKRIIGSLDIPDGNGSTRKVTFGDVALLVPAGTAYWIYEAELERAGIPVAPQAGKGFLSRQEVLDLTALARVMSDPRDTLALGAFLRGPVLGFTDEEILDALAALPDTGRKRLSLNIDISSLTNDRLREALEKLRTLRRMSTTTTPFHALSAAIEAFSIRAVLTIRHPRSVERSLANLDAFLSLSRAWDARGLKNFADEMRRRREDGTRQAEGRPDSGADAISIVTMHSAKGLEWPVVVPINMATIIQERSGPVSTATGLLFSFLGHEVPGYAIANAAESNERSRERARLLYVADTRARDLLVLPRHSVEGNRPSWNKVCMSRVADLTAFDHSAFSPDLPSRSAPIDCPQDEAEFIADARRIANAHRLIKRRTPSRHEAGFEPVVGTDVIALDEEAADRPAVQGSATRGTILHKLIEEVLTGETAENAVSDRAKELIYELDAGDKIDPGEVSATITRTLGLSRVVELRDRLVPEVDLANLIESAESGELTVGVADAVAVGEDGIIDAVIDWKSDVDPDTATLNGYRSQMSDYLSATRASLGLIVLMTSGRVLEVAANPAPEDR